MITEYLHHLSMCSFLQRDQVERFLLKFLKKDRIVLRTRIFHTNDGKLTVRMNEYAGIQHV